jgi:hypothetical protein
VAKFDGLEIRGFNRFPGSEQITLFTESRTGGASDSLQYDFLFDSELDADDFEEFLRHIAKR